MKMINGIRAAWLEHDGKGRLAIKGRSVVYSGFDGYSVSWACATPAVAEQHLKLFRAATKHQATRAA